MSTRALERAVVGWNRSRLDLDSDEMLAQVLDRGDLAAWSELYALAANDPRLRLRILGVVGRVPLPFPFFWRAAMSAMPVTQGIHQLYTSAEQIAPFRIVTPSGADSFYIKLTDASTGVLVMTFFVQGGQSFEAVVPVGTYRVKYATGATWYGVDFVFGPDTRFS